MADQSTSSSAPFLLACKRLEAPHTPIWIMRQAGRYQASYRAIRANYSMLELCQNPEQVTKVTLLPIEQFGMDAAILFSDITIPFLGMGVNFDIVPGVGPVVENPVGSAEDVTKLRKPDMLGELGYIDQAVRLLKNELSVPLIGFAGAPFTLSAYLIEGKPSRDFKKVRAFIFKEPEAWNALMEKLTDITIDYLRMQADAGADVLQVFDSWVGGIHPDMYTEHLLPHMKRLFTSLSELGKPLIHFGTGTSPLLELLQEAGGDVIGIDWKTPLGKAWERLGYDKVAVQGNLDPAVLLAPFDTVKREVDKVLAEAGGRPGHIFNLGHGVWPETSEDTVKRLVEYVREKSTR